MSDKDLRWWHPHDGSGRMECVRVISQYDRRRTLVGSRWTNSETWPVADDELSPYNPLPEHDVESVEAWLDA